MVSFDAAVMQCGVDVIECTRLIYLPGKAERRAEILSAAKQKAWSGD
jgi:hypothetical protein